jgi:hypothetical protein
MAVAAPAPVMMPQMQAAIPTMAAPAALAMPAVMAPAAAPPSGCDAAANNRPRLTREQLDELAKQVQALEKMMNAQPAAPDDRKGCQK